VRTLSAVEVARAEDAGRAVTHLTHILFRYDCAAWAAGSTLHVSLELQGESAAQRMAAWRRIVAEELEVLGIEVVGYE
jgi:hypothetical protein